ncbi:MAG: hypothetical protein Q7W30_00435 [Coriobacteriia bacterium]|nr:hypothetical protein [Coriobacteriia bacterium]
MKVQSIRSDAAFGRALAVLSAAFALVLLLTPAPAHAITRAEILTRANHWVAKRVPYSQSRFFQGYRQDCSGFVSMAWKMGRSHTTRTMPRYSRRIPIGQLRPGDAVLTPGHLAVFGGWKSRRARTFVAIEESTYGHPAMRRVKRMPAGAIGLRRPAITVTPSLLVPPSTEVTLPPANLVTPAPTLALDVLP